MVLKLPVWRRTRLPSLIAGPRSFLLAAGMLAAAMPAWSSDEGALQRAERGFALLREDLRDRATPDPLDLLVALVVGALGVAMAMQSIMLGDSDVVIAGGMENMSQVPYYLPSVRWGAKYGHQQTVDCLAKDGLTDVYGQVPMGQCAELCAKEYNITREEQDAFAIQSYKRSAEAWAQGRFTEEIVPVRVPSKKGENLVSTDEEYQSVQFEKIPTLKPVFQKDGTITAANASTMNDGAAVLILMSKEKVEKLGLKPLARIVSYADAEQAPEWFTTTPSIALPKAVKKAGLALDQIDYFELNEAFSVVGIANIKKMNLNPDRVNVNGGAVSLGHPLGASGARILVTLLQVLHQKQARYGAAAICNGGGGASAMVIERL